jgi:hypothetical protein
MLTCDEAIPLLVRAADGTLEPHERLRLDRHVRACTPCAQALVEQTEVAGLLRAMPASEPPARVAHAIALRIAGSSDWLAVVDWRKWSWRLAPMAATLLLAALSLHTWTSTDIEADTFPRMVEQLTIGESQELEPATALFWQTEVERDSLVYAVLTGSADERFEADDDAR